MMEDMELGPGQIDALREIGSIAAGNASTSLSRMLGKKATVRLPRLAVESILRAPELLGEPEERVAAVYTSVTGDASGSVLVTLPVSEAGRLAGMLTGEEVRQPGALGEMGTSALKELANILVGSYLRALSQLLGMTLTHSVPGFASDMVEAIMDGIVARQSLEAECIVAVEALLAVEGSSCGVHMSFLLDPGTLAAILEALGLRKEYGT